MKGNPLTIYCQVCDVGYYSRGERPLSCPNEACLSQTPNWTTVKPFKPSVDDRQFLRSLRIKAD